MAVVAVLNQKGGSGKTTVATHLARAFQLDGKSVLLVDSDPQGSARDWGAVDETIMVPVVGLDRPSLDRDLRTISRGIDWIIIDSAPQTADLSIAALRAADVVIIPVQPSPYDVWATADLVRLVKQRIEVTHGRLAAAFLISRAIKGTRISKDVRGTLEEYGLPVLNTKIAQRVVYPISAAHGRTVFELEPGGEAVSEIKKVMNEVRAMFNAINKTTAAD